MNDTPVAAGAGDPGGPSEAPLGEIVGHTLGEDVGSKPVEVALDKIVVGEADYWQSLDVLRHFHQDKG